MEMTDRQLEKYEKVFYELIIEKAKAKSDDNKKISVADLEEIIKEIREMLKR